MRKLFGNNLTTGVIFIDIRWEFDKEVNVLFKILNQVSNKQSSLFTDPCVIKIKLSWL